jgi:hypothetical protein
MFRPSLASTEREPLPLGSPPVSTLSVASAHSALKNSFSTLQLVQLLFTIGDFLPASPPASNFQPRASGTFRQPVRMPFQ